MNVTQDLILLSRSKVASFFNTNISVAYDTIKQTYLDFSVSKCMNPPSSFLWYDNNSNSRIIGLSAYLGNESCPGIKWIASCPNNINHGLTRASAVIVLNDFTTGFPIAIIEGATISALRTALSAILALEHLHPSKTISNLGIAGGGNLAIVFLQCLNLLGWKINNCQVYDKNEKQITYMQENQETIITLAPNRDHMLKNSDVVLFTTTVVEPYIDDPCLFKAGAVILNLSLRDLSPGVILSAYNIVDDVEHVLAANTGPHLAFLKVGHKEFIAGNIMQLVSGNIKAPTSKLKIFSPMGMGILDIALANLILTANLNDEHLVTKDFFK